MQPLDPQGRTVLHLKDLIHISSETESQGHGMTFNMIYLRSKYPYSKMNKELDWKQNEVFVYLKPEEILKNNTNMILSSKKNR